LRRATGATRESFATAVFFREKDVRVVPANTLARIDHASVYLLTGRRDDALKDLDID
jgi:hypothetical protein